MEPGTCTVKDLDLFAALPAMTVAGPGAKPADHGPLSGEGDGRPSPELHHA